MPVIALGYESRLRGTGFSKVKKISVQDWLDGWGLLPAGVVKPKHVYSDDVVESFELLMRLKLVSQLTLSAVGYKALKASGYGR